MLGCRGICVVAMLGLAIDHASSALGAETVSQTDHNAIVGTSNSNSGIPQPQLLKALIAWASAETGLPSTNHLPRVVLVTREDLETLRYALAAPGSQVESLDQSDEVMSFYNTIERKILLQVGWSGRTPAESSILVHEMVHHLQTEAGIKFDCPEEREALAYEAQQKWLGKFGTSLAQEFGIDKLTLLVRTHCPM